MALVLLDLRSAFDLVDHNILISRLESCVGLQGKVLKWFQSFRLTEALVFLLANIVRPHTHLLVGCHRVQFLLQFYCLYSWYL